MRPTGRGWNRVPAKWGMPRIRATSQGRRGQGRVLPRAQREHSSADTLVVDFWPSEPWKNILLWPSLWSLVIAVPGDGYTNLKSFVKWFLTFTMCNLILFFLSFFYFNVLHNLVHWFQILLVDCDPQYEKKYWTRNCFPSLRDCGSMGSK